MKRFKYRYFVLITIVILLFTGCADIIEEDIRGKQLILVAPGSGVVTEYNTILFYWEPVSGAGAYQVQIATPSFQNAETIVIDSTVNFNSMEVSLDSGSYEWRARAFNGYYSTPYSSNQFTIVSTKDLSDSKVGLVSPNNELFTNDTTILFIWDPLIIADYYVIHINHGEIFEQLVHGTQFTFNFPKENREVEWWVSAVNETSVTNSLKFKFTMDFVPPIQPILTGPASDTVFLGFPVSLRWQHSSDDVNLDSLFILDNLGRVIDNFPRSTGSRFFELNNGDLPSRGRFSWGVKSVDKAGNVSSGVLQTRSFTWQ